MFRRSRFSVKPNVRPKATARSGGGGGGDDSSSSSSATDGGGGGGGDGLGSPPTTLSSAAAGGSALPPGDAPAAGGLLQPGGDDSHGGRSKKTSDAGSERDGSKRAEILLQRRKRISTVPNLAKPRVTLPPVQRPVNLASKCPPKQVSRPSTFASPPLQKEWPSPEKVNVESSPKSPVLPERKTPVPQVPQFSPFKKSVNKEPSAHVTTPRSDEALEKSTSTPLKERPTQEKTLEEEVNSQVQSKSAPAREKKIYSDREKIIKTKKLRKMLKEELKKEKDQRKYKSLVIEKNMPEDRSKMIMRDFIYYLPENNPMKSSLVEEKRKEKTSTVTQAKEPEEIIVTDHVDGNEEDDNEEEGEDDGPLLVPRVKVAEDGSIILDEESLTVEVLRTKGQCVMEENDPIFERGSTTTYSSFRRNYYTKPWSEKETEMFFLAISMVGTDFSMISQLFPHRARTEIKNKFKREEKANGWRIDKAFKEKRPFDFNFFTKLLEKILENERKRKEKDAKCQQQREKKLNEKKTSKSQKKQQGMEVDVGTAEKENEEAPSVLEPAEGPSAPEAGVAKRKRKRKKKDSDPETENLPEETSTPAETADRERSRKKRKNISAIEINGINEAGEDSDVPDGATPDEIPPVVEEVLQCYTLDEAAEGDEASSVQEPGEDDALEATSGQHAEQPSESPDPHREEIATTKNVVSELDQLGENETTASPHCEDEIRETEIVITEKPTEAEQQQIITPDVITADLTGAEEKNELLVDDTLEVKIAPSESTGFEEKSTEEDNPADIIGPVREETRRTTNDTESKSQETGNAPGGKADVRSRWQRPKPNILKASCRKDARVQSKLNTPEPDESKRKNTTQKEVYGVSSGGTPEKDSHISDTALLTAKKPTFQESSKQATLKPALLARGRMQRPRPNLGRLVRRQGGSAKNTGAAEEKRTGAATEAEKTLTQTECNSSEFLSENAIEPHSHEVGRALSKELENETVASAEQEDTHSPKTNLLEYESPTLQTTSLSSCTLGDVTDLSTSDFSLEQEKKEDLTGTEETLKSYSPSLNQSLEKEAKEGDPLQMGNKGLDNKHETEMAEESLVNISGECSKSSNLDEEAHCSTMAAVDNQETVPTRKLLLPPPNSLECKNSEQSEVLLASDIQKNISVGKENSQGLRKQSTVRPALLLRSRFQKPKPNIGRAVGRKEAQPLEGHETTGTIVAAEKLELQKTETLGTPPIMARLPQLLPVQSLEKKPVSHEKKIPEDSQVPSTSHSVSDQHLSREKPIPQEGKQSVIKPAQLVRGRFQRARPSLGRLQGKKEDTVSENIHPPVEQEEGKPSVEILKKDDSPQPPEDEVSVQESLDNLEKKDVPESSEGTSPERCIDQKKTSSSENSQGCVSLVDEEADVTKDDDEGKALDIPESDISAPQERSHQKSSQPAQSPRSHLQKPKPNVTQTSKNNEPVSSEDTTTQDMAGREAENSASPGGSTSGKMSPLTQVSQNLVEADSTAKSLKQKTCADGIETVSLKRSRHSGGPNISEQPSGNESQIKEEISKPASVLERSLKGKQPVRTLKRKKTSGDSRTFCASECESDLNRKGKHCPRSKAHASRGKSLKPALHKKPRKESGSAKVSLVTLRASSQEEEDDDDDGDDFELDYEAESFSPEEVNKAPVFVPKGLRSPNPVPVQIEETMEEIEIYENVADGSCLPHELHVDSQPVVQDVNQLYSSQVFIQEEQKEKTGINDGSTEAAMTLLAMRDPMFQLNIGTQEPTQEHANKDEPNTADSLRTEHSEAESLVPCNVPYSATSKNELVPSDTMNETITEGCTTEPPRSRDCLQEGVNLQLSPFSKNELASSCSTTGLEEGSQEKSRASSDLSTSKGMKTLRLARCRFPKPKPNLNRGLGLKRNAPHRSLSSGEEQGFSENKNAEKETSSSCTGNRKAQPDENLKSAEPAQSSPEEEHGLLPGSAGPAMQKIKLEREDLPEETWEVALEFMTPNAPPEAETCLPELQRSPNTNTDAQVSGLDGQQLAVADVAEAEVMNQSGISVTREMTTVSIKESPTTEEEPTFILTLVEIPAGSEDCRGVPGSLEPTSAELLPAPVLFTSANTDAVELTKEDGPGSVPATVEENAVSINSSTGREELHILSSRKLTDLSSLSLENLKSCPIAQEGNGDPRKKNIPASSTEEALENSNKKNSPKLRCTPKQADEKKSEKSSISKKKLPELYVKDKEHAQSSINLRAMHFGEAATSDERMSRTLHGRKAESTEKQSSVDTCKSVPSEQVRGTEALPKAPLSRSNQRSFGFLPLICKDNADEAVTTTPSKGLHQETDTVLSENTTDYPVSSRDDKGAAQESTSVPSAIPASSKCEKGICSTVQVSSELSDSEGCKEQEKEGEPTKISEYFFGDIFMEVDDSE